MIASLIVYVHVKGSFKPAGILERIGPDWPPNARAARFRYGDLWLKDPDAFPIDPFNLPLLKDWQLCRESWQIHYAFRDVAPDGWGQQVLMAQFPGERMGIIEFLAASGDDKVGCLGFGPLVKGKVPQTPSRLTPDGSQIPESPVHALQDLLEAAEALHEGNPLPQHLLALLDRGSSLGGARPKASYRDEAGKLWVAKFPLRDGSDAFEHPRVEAACLDMAEACGIPTPARQLVLLGSIPVLLTERFDRVQTQDGEHRLAYLSAQGVLDAAPDEFYLRKKYSDLAATARRLGQTDAGPDVFRRMLFNVAIGNTDDHGRNHAFIRHADGKWRLSPVFDLVPHNRSNKMVFGLATGHVPDLQDALAAFPSFGLREEEASTQYNRVVEVVASWRQYMKARDVTDKDLETVAPSFADLSASKAA